MTSRRILLTVWILIVPISQFSEVQEVLVEKQQTLHLNKNLFECL